ncbi:MAG: PRC-barrel domain containing protein [Spirochaetes bacterium]|jgi:sporulation protein YlmC with PRC-barrel domain|nr:PRC-barrel domain containing protein [Spirochaetota bacterium]
MLRNVDHLAGFGLEAQDGPIGKAEHVFFDDDDWTIRYLVVQTGNWIRRKHVLVSPIFITTINWPEETISVNLTQEQIRHSPDVNMKEPISRRQEREFHKHYQAPAYWAGYGLWGTGMHPEDVMAIKPPRKSPAEDSAEGKGDESGEVHLRSSAKVSGYSILAHRGEIGKVSDFIFDDRTWAIRYLVVNTGRFLGGKQVLIAPRWTKEISWKRQQMYVDMENSKIEDAPEYNPDEPVTPEYEQKLFEHYGRRSPWKAV